MTTLNNQKVDLLRKAQDLLRERGWCKGAFEQPWGGICANGAICTVTTGGANPYAFSNKLAEELRQVVIQDLPMPTRPVMDSVGRICQFNNEEAETVEDVIAQFQITIDRLERERAPRDDRELVAV